jgi:hypothetical protein
LTGLLSGGGGGESYATAIEKKEEKRLCAMLDQGSILQNSISAANFFGRVFILKFWTNFHPQYKTYKCIRVLWTAILNFKEFYSHMHTRSYKLEFDQIRFNRKFWPKRIHKIDSS